MAAAAASLLGLGAATVGPPPSAPPATPGAAAAFELLRPLAKTAPAAPGSGESRDDRLLENFLATLGRFEDVGEVKIGENLGMSLDLLKFGETWDVKRCPGMCCYCLRQWQELAKKKFGMWMDFWSTWNLDEALGDASRLEVVKVGIWPAHASAIKAVSTALGIDHLLPQLLSHRCRASRRCQHQLQLHQCQHQCQHQWRGMVLGSIPKGMDQKPIQAGAPESPS